MNVTRVDDRCCDLVYRVVSKRGWQEKEFVEEYFCPCPESRGLFRYQDPKGLIKEVRLGGVNGPITLGFSRPCLRVVVSSSDGVNGEFGGAIGTVRRIEAIPLDEIKQWPQCRLRGYLGDSALS